MVVGVGCDRPADPHGASVADRRGGRVPATTASRLSGDHAGLVGEGELVSEATIERERYSMRLGALWLPFLALFGATPAGSFVEVTPASVRFRFGRLFDETIPRGIIGGVAPAKWPLLRGIGWRTARGETIGLIGTLKNTVEVTLREPLQVRFVFFQKRCQRIVVSLREPEAFSEQLGSTATPPTPDG